MKERKNRAKKIRGVKKVSPYIFCGFSIFFCYYFQLQIETFYIFLSQNFASAILAVNNNY